MIDDNEMDLLMNMVPEKEEYEKVPRFDIAPLTETYDGEYDPSNITTHVPTFLREVDAVSDGGFPKGEISVVMGESGFGKTTFALNTATKQAQKNYKTLFLSMEMRNVRVIPRVLAMISNTEEYSWRLKNIAKLENFANKKEEGLKIIQKYLGDNLYLYDKKEPLENIIEILHWAHAEGFDIVYVDNWQLMTSNSIKGMDKTQLNEKMAENLREVVRTLNLSLVMLSQVTKGQNNKKENKTKFGEKIREDSGLVLSLYAPPEDEGPSNDVICYIHKNRYGKAGDEYTYVFHREKQRFDNYHYRVLPEYNQRDIPPTEELVIAGLDFNEFTTQINEYVANEEVIPAIDDNQWDVFKGEFDF